MKKVFSLALAALSLSALAEPPTRSEAPAHIDVSRLPAQSKMIDDVVVPVPSEIFGVLDKFGKPNWSLFQHPMSGVAQPLGEQPQIALQFGAVIAEGFIAVEAEDANEVKRIGKSVLNLAKALAVDRDVKSRALAITDAADRKDWNEVRKELDSALDDVKKAMARLNSDALSQLVSLGGWLRGTEALTAVVDKNYTKDGAELLHQPVLLDYFEKRLAGLKPKYKANPVIIKVNKGVLDIRPLVGLGTDSEISEKSVKEINAITADLLNSINSKAPVKTETPFVKRFFPFISVLIAIALTATPALATIDDALSFALEAATPYVKEGFTVREDYWGGDLPVKTTKAIVHQLFKGNEYWFWMGTDTAKAKISVHVYDSEGNLAEAEAWTKPHFAAARVVPKKTGSYYLIVEIEKSPEERTYWSLAYGFR